MSIPGAAGRDAVPAHSVATHDVLNLDAMRNVNPRSERRLLRISVSNERLPAAYFAGPIRSQPMKAKDTIEPLLNRRIYLPTLADYSKRRRMEERQLQRASSLQQLKPN